MHFWLGSDDQTLEDQGRTGRARAGQPDAAAADAADAKGVAIGGSPVMAGGDSHVLPQKWKKLGGSNVIYVMIPPGVIFSFIGKSLNK